MEQIDEDGRWNGVPLNQLKYLMQYTICMPLKTP